LMTRELELAALGLSTVESIPVFHYAPGGLAARPLIVGVDRPLYECESFSVCLFGRGPVELETYRVPVDRVMARARAWGVDVVFLDGLEPLASLGREGVEAVVDAARKAGMAVGARTMGYRLDPGLLELLDFLVIDYMPDYWYDEAMSVDAIKALKEARDRKLWVEVSAYLREPKNDYKIHPLVLALRGTRYPLHVHVEDHGGGMPLTRMAEDLGRKLEFVYIHNDLYPSLDTLCPSCKAPVASRDEGFLRVLELGEDSKCWKCGYPLPFYRVQRKKTPEHVLYSLGGVLAWYPVDRMAASGSAGTSGRPSSGSP